MQDMAADQLTQQLTCWISTLTEAPAQSSFNLGSRVVIHHVCHAWKSVFETYFFQTCVHRNLRIPWGGFFDHSRPNGATHFRLISGFDKAGCPKLGI